MSDMLRNSYATSLDNGIPITLTSYIPPGMEILVFGQYHTMVTEDDIAIAWRVYPSGNPTTIQFLYPNETQVGVFYVQDNTKITIGPTVANPGTIWNYVTTSHTDPGKLQRDNSIISKSNSLYAVFNKPPISGDEWEGRAVNIGLYKGGDLFMAQANVGVGNYVEFELHQKLYFGVLVNWEDLTSIDEILEVSQITEIDLAQFPNGLDIKLTQDSNTKKFKFSTKSKI